MIRTLICATLALFLVAGVGLADKGKGKGKKAKPMGGTVTKFNAETGELTVTGGKKKGPATVKDFKLTDAVSFEIIEGETSKTVTGKEGFKELKTGDKVRVTADADGKVTKVQIGAKKKKKKNK